MRGLGGKDVLYKMWVHAWISHLVLIWCLSALVRCEHLHVERKSVQILELLRARFENWQLGIALVVSAFPWKIQFASVLYLI